MIVIFGSRKTFKREGQTGQLCCPNCGHVVQQTLCRQVNEATLFFIPIVRQTKQRGLLCENCGVIQPLSKTEYKEKMMLAAQNA